MNQVIVACKIPGGMFLEAGTFGQENYARVQIAGPNSHIRDGKNYGLIVGGYAFTPVPKDVWDEFYKNHKTAGYIKNRAVYMEDSLDKAHAAALTDGKTKTGFERLNPDAPSKDLTPDADHLKKSKAESLDQTNQ